MTTNNSQSAVDSARDTAVDTPRASNDAQIRIIPEEQWRCAMQAHDDRVQQLTAEHRDRRARGLRHPVWDFLFSYYSITPGQLSHYSPGPQVLLELPEDQDIPQGIRQPKYFTRRILSDEAGHHSGIMLDRDAFMAQRGDTATYIRRLLQATQGRESHFDCFGLHEWAMVYRGQHRHPDPLRLTQEDTDEVVEKHSIRCTHWDAYRFFTEPAVPLNTCSPQPGEQMQWEQPACLHAGMDLYKWASKLGPVVPADLWIDSFQLACDIRQLDMEASPYDLREWGFRPVKIETTEGKREYVQRQKEFSERGNNIRSQLLNLLSLL